MDYIDRMNILVKEARATLILAGYQSDLTRMIMKRWLNNPCINQNDC